MFRFVAPALISMALASTAYAGSSHKFDSSISQVISTPVKVEVVVAEDLAYRADNMPKKRIRGSFNDAFGNHGHLGERDIEKLAERLERKITDRLKREGVAVDANAATTLRLVLTDARPNRPTFSQLGEQPGLSYRSVSIGGASFEGELVSGSEVLGDIEYAWYDTDIRDAQFSGTWGDANRAIDRFAKKTAKSLRQ